MNKYLTPEEYQQLQQDVGAGKTRINIPRSVARQFFIRVDNRSIKATTEDSAFIQKIIVWVGTVCAPLFFLLCAVLLVVQLGWLSAFAVPLVGIFWTVLAGFTSERGGWKDITAALAATFVVFLLSAGNYTLILFIFTLSIWTHRMTFMLAQYFLTQIVTSSFNAYDMLVEHVTLEPLAIRGQ